MRNKAGCMGYSGNGAFIYWERKAQTCVLINSFVIGVVLMKLRCCNECACQRGIADIKPIEFESRLDLL
jgi:hypothetical protein